VTVTSSPAIGTNLRRLAGMHGLLQRELAAYLGLSDQGLWNILNGRSEPRTRTVQLCARAFGITVDDLLGDTGDCLRAAAAEYEAAPIRAAHAAADHRADSPTGRRASGRLVRSRSSSSVGEHPLHTRGVAGSNPASTIGSAGPLGES
jgi:transcriptional regulator with XRE-family HTH domain